MNYDKAYFAEKNLPPPQTLEDLLKPEYKGLLVVENPASSSPGLAFLLATIGHYGDPGYLKFWEGLVANDVKVVNDWETAYRAEFSGSTGQGLYPVVVSYGSSPPFEVMYAETPIDDPPTAVITGEDMLPPDRVRRHITGHQKQEMAEKWVDYMLSTTFQEDMPLQMFVFPVNTDAKLDETFVKYLGIPAKPAYVSPQDIAANRQKWLEAWTEVVLR